MTPEKDLDKPLDFVTFLGQINTLAIFLHHLEEQDFRALSLCCQLTLEQFKKLEEVLKKQKKTFRNPERYLLLSELRGHHDIELKPLPLSKYKWEIKGMALPVNGEWLFVIHASASPYGMRMKSLIREEFKLQRYCLDIYHRESASPLCFSHVKRRQYYTPHFIYSGRMILGVDNNTENPGIYFRPDPDRKTVCSYHLKEKELLIIEMPVGREPARDTVMHGDASGLTCYQLQNNDHGGVQLRKITGIGTETRTIMETDLPNTYAPDGFKLCLSPNGHRLLVLSGHADVFETQTLTCRYSGPNPRSATTEFGEDASITDDGFSVITSRQIFPLNGRSNIKESTRGSFFAHSGNGQIFLRAQNGNIRQFFPMRFTLRRETSNEIVKSVPDGYTPHFYLDSDQDGFRPDLSLATIQSMHLTAETQTLLCERSLRFDAPLVMALLLKELFIWEYKLLFATDISLLRCIEYLARNAQAYEMAATQLHLAGLCALAKSELGQSIIEESLEVAIEKYVKKDLAVPTADLGTLHTRSFFWSIKANDRLDDYWRRDLSQILLKRTRDWFTLCASIGGDHLLLLSKFVEPGIRVIDLCGQSRHETYDKKYKKLIPKSFSAALKNHPKLRNAYSLDALLKKLVSWLPEDEAQELESARQRMHDAVAANPSLRPDTVQLLSVRFYRQRNIISAISDPHYRDLIAEHLAPGHDFSLNIEIDEDYSASRRPGRGW